ncbi:Cytidine deaminase [Hartmannibacter diazotrophicus]|uniref:Cytidine deaminase n=1 Tax=Hartmannibacter diazotrophicus TaxID=1482074 RepID=A0A2C9D343_9HYPH|nr:cytidine deaminase [Hartmannibacter diazotrophicus]SON54201.1 Cytidine deaminase [Hartmannibacter diazotrophicus]
MDNFQVLFEAASAARAKAHAPYSKFHVGAALIDDKGNLHAGCNIENASYPEGWCAETSAISHMVMGGGLRIRTALVVAPRIDGGRFCTPCGGCRQRLAEFSDADVRVYACDPDGAHAEFTMARLLPAGFSLVGYDASTE